MTVARFLLCTVALVLGGLAGSGVRAETVEDQVRRVRAAEPDGPGTTPENASALGSFGFTELEKKLPGIYGKTKQTFRLAVEHWEDDYNSPLNKDEPHRKLGGTLERMLRNQYLGQVEKFLPDLERNVYSPADRDRIKKLLLGETPPADGGWQTPNNALARHVAAYLDDLIEKGGPSPEPIFKRLLGTLDRRAGGAPLGGGDAPKYGRLNITAKAAGALVHPIKINLQYGKKSVLDERETDEISANPCLYRGATGKWSVTASVDGFVSQTKEVEIVEGTTVTLEFNLVAGAGAATPSRGDRTLPGLSPAELAIIHHQRQAGRTVVAYDPAALALAWQSLPSNYQDLLRPYQGTMAISTNARGGRGHVADMTGQAPNPAFNDPWLKIKLEWVRGEGAAPADPAEIAKYTQDIVWCVAQWVNAARELAQIRFEPLACIEVNDSFYARIESIQWREDPRSNFGAIQWKHYATWEKPAWEAAAHTANAPARFFTADPGQGVPDLIVRLKSGTSNGNDASDNIGWFHPEDATHRGVIEIQLSGRKYDAVLAGSDFAIAADNQHKLSFRRVMLHELGHYFGLNHLPANATDAEKAVFTSCIMNSRYPLLGDNVLAVDMMLISGSTFLSMDVRGRPCAGLIYDAPSSPSPSPSAKP